MKALVVAALLVAGCSRERPPAVTVGAAAVTRHAMPELVELHRQRSGVRIDVIYGASDSLVARARAGTPLDVLVLAGEDAFDAVASPPVRIATTELVLVGPAGTGHRFATLANVSVAIGDPAAVPVGRYARRLLEQLQLWDAVRRRAQLGGDVAGVLSIARQGKADVAIVYAADAGEAAPLVVLDRATHAIPIAAATMIGASPAAEASAFVRFLASPPAREVLGRHGFAAP